MKSFTLNTDTYFLPESWQQVSYGQYCEIAAIQADTSTTGKHKAAQVIAALCSIPLETIQQAGIQLVIPLFEQLSFLSAAPLPIPTNQVTIQGQVFQAQPIRYFGELAAFDKVEQAFQQEPLKKLPYLLAILLRKELPATPAPTASRLLSFFKSKPAATPQVEVFQNEAQWLEQRARYFTLHLSPVQMLGLAAFFLSKEQLSQQLTRLCSRSQHMAQQLSESLGAMSEKSTGGTLRSMIYRKIYCFTLRSLLSRWTKY